MIEQNYEIIDKVKLPDDILMRLAHNKELNFYYVAKFHFEKLVEFIKFGNELEALDCFCRAQGFDDDLPPLKNYISVI